MPQVKPEVETFARIKVLGVGGSGKNAVNHMINTKVRGVEFIVINTDAQELQSSLSKKKIVPVSQGTLPTHTPLFIIFLVILLFGVACVYSSFDVVVEADFLSGKKFEARDEELVYAEKQSSPDAVLVSPALFTPQPGIIFEFLPSFFFPNTLFTETFSILRC